MHHGARALFLGREGTLLQLAVHVTLLEGDAALDLAVVGLYGHKLRAALGRAGTKTVKTQGILVGAALVVVVFTACVKLAVDQIPVPASLGLVPAKRNAASAVVHLDALVEEDLDADLRAVTLSRLVHRVGKDLKKGMLAALKAVRAEDDRRALAYAIRAFQGLYALIVVFLLNVFLACHVEEKLLSSALLEPIILYYNRKRAV